MDTTELDRYSRQTQTLLQHLQYGENVPTLLFSQDPTGLGGQISRRLVGLKLALMFERKVVFPHLTEPPYGQVFEPIHSNFDFASELPSAVDFGSDNSSLAQIVKLDFWDLWGNSTLRQRVYDTVPTELSCIEEPGIFLDGLLLSFCRLIEAHQRVVEEAAARLKVGDDTLGVHIRRGDKSVETPFVPIDVINEHIGRLCEERGFCRVFAASDDPEIFSKLKLPAGVALSVDETEQRYNNANHRLLMKTPDLSAQETTTAVKNIYLLGRCGAIVGQSNAHFARLAAAQVSLRNGGKFGILIDGDYVLQQSRHRRVMHNGKLAIRAVARKLLPWATLRHAKRKLS